MAIITSWSKSIAFKQFDGSGWPEPEFATMPDGYTSIGYQLPVDKTWINKPVGTLLKGGSVLALPRSVESEIIPPQTGTLGNRGWKLKEC